MTTKEYLSQVKKLDKMINGRLRDLEDMKDLAVSISSKRPVADLVISSGRKDRLESIVVKILDAESEIDAMVDKYIDQRSVIVDQIESLDIKEFSVLRMKFIDGWGADKILEQLNKDDIYSERQMYRICNKAMDIFEKKYGKTYLSA